ncbi:MAG: hypothetical protein FWC25_01735 [Dehalococcoidia bacterium]|nr:hypothetical protein [Dehalococcoidia bacterium]
MANCTMSNIHRIWIYRGLVALGLVLAFLLTLAIPQHMKENNDWSLQYAVQNFADGQLTIDKNTFDLQNAEAHTHDASLDQYVQVESKRWAYTEAPGYVFYLLPFYYMHVLALGNWLLAIGMAVVVYLLLKHLKDERVACFGALLWLFSPVALAMLQRAYSSTFASAAFLGMGGGLYIYYCLRRSELSRWAAWGLLSLSGLGLGWSIFVNYANILVVAVFLLHFTYLQLRLYLNGQRKIAAWSPLWFCFSLLLPLVGLLIYQDAVFDSLFRFGFQYAELPVSFGWQFIQVNIKQVVVAWLIGFPLLVPGLAALVWALCLRFHGKMFSDDLLLLCAGWVLAVFGVYLTYEWTATSNMVGMPFIMLACYTLPGLLPLTLLSAQWLNQLSRRALLWVAIPLLIWGVVFFAQSALAYPEVPVNPLNPWRRSTIQLQDSFHEGYFSVASIAGGDVDV